MHGLYRRMEYWSVWARTRRETLICVRKEAELSRTQKLAPDATVGSTNTMQRGIMMDFSSHQHATSQRGIVSATGDDTQGRSPTGKHLGVSVNCFSYHSIPASSNHVPEQ